MTRPSWTQYVLDERTKQRRTAKTDDLLEQNTRRAEQEVWRERKEKKDLLWLDWVVKKNYNLLD